VSKEKSSIWARYIGSSNRAQVKGSVAARASINAALAPLHHHRIAFTTLPMGLFVSVFLPISADQLIEVLSIYIGARKAPTLIINVTRAHLLARLPWTPILRMVESLALN
jgi:hypothetical protein